MPTLRDHARATFARCRKILPDRIGCGGYVFWGPADGPAHVLGLEGCCSHCGMLWYTGDLLKGGPQPQPIAPRGPGRPRGSGRPFKVGNTSGRWTRLRKIA